MLHILGLLAGTAAAAQSSTDTIVITAERPPSRVTTPTVELTPEELRQRQPSTAADALKAVPGVTARTNSRGETVARVRGSEERQTQVFLDGAPLAVPWDGRADIGVLPAGLIDRVTVTKGAVPIEYGTNAVAGAVDFHTRWSEEPSFRGRSSVGLLGYADASAVATAPAGPLNLTLGSAFLTRNAQPVASLSELPFSQPRSRRRVNTDLDSLSLFAASRYERGPLTLRVSLFHLAADRGIAPESDRDPAVDAPRYWRYPDVRQTQLTIGSDIDIGERNSVRLVGWRQWFAQSIVQYRDVTYSSVRVREDDEDDTFGARLVFSSALLQPVNLRLVGTAQTSRHAQVDRSFPSTAEPLRNVFRQNLVTIGGEADLPVGAGRATLGLAYDASTNPRTGDKPEQPSTGAAAFSAAYRVPLSSRTQLTLSGGRRNRFPSARELFGEALGRFLPNPELRPEQAWLADAELTYRAGALELAVNPFATRMKDSIAQRIVTVDGRRLRQRFNLSGSWSVGVDAGAAWQLSRIARLELGGTLLHARADKDGNAFRHLPQRPSHELSAALTYEPVEQLSLRAELRHIGPAFDLAPSGSLVRLPASHEANLRGRWAIGRIGTASRVNMIAAVDNVTDATITPQLGLPLPGRTFRLGFEIDSD